jgi:erythromycin esterase
MKSIVILVVATLSFLYLSCASADNPDGNGAWPAGTAIPLKGKQDLQPLLDHIGHARVVLLGEASHGTSEYYSWRAEISKRLLSKYGFNCIAVEGDWPSCQSVNSYIKQYPNSATSAIEALYQFQRWPRWMWANQETANLVEWLTAFNKKRNHGKKVGFYGIDVYSMNRSLHAVLDYAREALPEQYDELHAAYGCLLPYGDDHNSYIRHTLSGSNCEQQAASALELLLAHAAQLQSRDENAFFDALQNAHVVASAERHYRAMADPAIDSWNARVDHMKATITRLLDHYGPDGRIIVWAHNTHIGDARATDMADAGMKNIGWLTRERFGHDDVAAVGFATYSGSVLAGRAWGANVEKMIVPPAIEGSIEHELNALGHDMLLLLFKGDTFPAKVRERRGHRAKGVVYHPEAERNNYVPTILAQRYDALIFLAETSALTPLDFEDKDATTPQRHQNRHEQQKPDGNASGPRVEILYAQAPDCPFPPKPPAGKEHVEERNTMVNRQIAVPRDGRITVKRKDVLDAMRAVPRHVMVPANMQRHAYDDSPLPIGHGQTISQPYIVAIMTELLELSPGDKVLEIGTGSGYQAAVLAHITPHVYSIEIVEPLYRRSRDVLAAQGYDCVRVKHGDGYHGWPEHGPYDAIIVTCAAGHLPPPLWAQLKPGGRIVIPIGGTHEVQRLVVVSKAKDGSRSSRTIMPVRFVPLTRGK